MRSRRAGKAAGWLSAAFSLALNYSRRRTTPQIAIRENMVERFSAAAAYPAPTPTSGPYRVRLATTGQERDAAYRLRFRVFNLELNEGLEAAFHTGADTDEFDGFCDHIIVQNERTKEVVGTYRLQSGTSAARNLGYYSAREFDFTPYEPLRASMIELGRACIHPDHRKYEVLMLLWRGIAAYAAQRNARYLIGCSSLSSQDPRLGSAMYRKLKSLEAPQQYCTVPTAEFALPLVETEDDVRPPKLLRTYLGLGAYICGPPALDRQFKTIDFLTLMDLNSLSPTIRNRLFR